MHEKRRLVESLDLNSVKKKFLSKKSWWWTLRNDTDELEKEYRQFLFLVSTNLDKNVVPWSRDLDDFWHEHILDTRKYDADCKKICGQYIHHDPNFKKGTAKHEYAIKETKKIYQGAFLDRNKRKARLGEESTTSGSCGADVDMVIPFMVGQSLLSSEQLPPEQPSNEDSDGSINDSSIGSDNSDGGSASCSSSSDSSSSSSCSSSSCSSSSCGSSCGSSCSSS